MAPRCETVFLRARESEQATTNPRPGKEATDDLIEVPFDAESSLEAALNEELFGSGSPEEDGMDEELLDAEAYLEAALNEELFGPESPDEDATDKELFGPEIADPLLSSQPTNAAEKPLPAPTHSLALPPRFAAAIYEKGQPIIQTSHVPVPPSSGTTACGSRQQTSQRSNLALPPLSAATTYTNAEPAAQSNGSALLVALVVPDIESGPSQGKHTSKMSKKAAKQMEISPIESPSKKRQRSDSLPTDSLPKKRQCQRQREGDYILCRFCEHPLRSEGGLRTHMQKIHNLFQEHAARAKCGICQKKFTANKAYDEHLDSYWACKWDRPIEWDVPYPRTRQERADTWALTTDGEVSPHLRVSIDQNGNIVSRGKVDGRKHLGLPLPRCDSVMGEGDPATAAANNLIDLEEELAKAAANNVIDLEEELAKAAANNVIDLSAGEPDGDTLAYAPMAEPRREDKEKEPETAAETTVINVFRKEELAEAWKLLEEELGADTYQQPLDDKTFGKVMAEFQKPNGSMQSPIMLD